MDGDAYIGRCRHGRLADGCAKCEDGAELASAAKTNAERQASLRNRRKVLEGLTEVRGIYAPPAKHAAIKAAARVLVTTKGKA